MRVRNAETAVATSLGTQDFAVRLAAVLLDLADCRLKLTEDGEWLGLVTTLEQSVQGSLFAD